MLVPVIRCTRMQDALDFYTRLLGFTCAGVWPATGDPAFAVLKRAGFEMQLSSHAGDGVVGQVIAVLVADVDAVAAQLRAGGSIPRRNRSRRCIRRR